MKTPLPIVFLAFALLAGCASTREKTFYWGEYSSTLYDWKKSPDEKTLEAHKKGLLLIMAESGKKNKKVPPGVYAEYGYLLLKEGNEVEGMELLDKETGLYPESVVFIRRIKGEYERRKK
jgi:hypothetical protein